MEQSAVNRPADKPDNIKKTFAGRINDAIDPRNEIIFSAFAFAFAFLQIADVFFVTLVGFVFLTASLTVALCFKGKLFPLVSVLPATILFFVTGRYVSGAAVLVAAVFSLICFLAVKYFRNKEYALVSCSALLAIIFVSVFLISVGREYGSLSKSAFSSLRDDTVSSSREYVGNAYDILSAELTVKQKESLIDRDAVTELIPSLVDSLFLLLPGLVVLLAMTLSYLPVLLIYSFIRSGSYRYAPSEEEAMLKIGMGPTVIFSGAVFVTVLALTFGGSSFSIIAVNLVLTHFLFYFVIGIRDTVMRLRDRRGYSRIIIYVVLLFVSPILPVLFVVTDGISAVFGLYFQKKAAQANKGNKQ